MIVADTHTIFWMTAIPEELSASASSALQMARDLGGGIAISDKSLWELAIMVNRKKVTAPLPLGPYLRMVERKFVVLPITAEIAEISESFSRVYPRDPADRIIGATALAHGLSLVTRDDAIRASNEVPCIW